MCSHLEGLQQQQEGSSFSFSFAQVSSNPDDRILIMGATNRPQELDDAVLRYSATLLWLHEKRGTQAKTQAGLKMSNMCKYTQAQKLGNFFSRLHRCSDLNKLLPLAHLLIFCNLDAKVRGSCHSVHVDRHFGHSENEAQKRSTQCGNGLVKLVLVIVSKNVTFENHYKVDGLFVCETFAVDYVLLICSKHRRSSAWEG